MLTADEVRAIRRDEVGTYKDQAIRYGVSYSTIRDLKQRRTYQEVEDDYLEISPALVVSVRQGPDGPVYSCPEPGTEVIPGSLKVSAYLPRLRFKGR